MRSASHKYGFVVQFRVNTDNCQSVLDAAQLLGIPTRDVSFGSLVSTVFATCLESWRQSGGLPKPDPFQYGARMEPYLDWKNLKGKGYAKEMVDKGPRWMRGTIAESRPAQTYIPTPEELAYQRAEEARLSGGAGVVRDGVWMGLNGGRMSPEDGLPDGAYSVGDQTYPDTTEAHEVPHDDELAQRFMALHNRREAGGLTDDEQAEYLRLNHLLFDGK